MSEKEKKPFFFDLNKEEHIGNEKQIQFDFMKQIYINFPQLSTMPFIPIDPNIMYQNQLFLAGLTNYGMINNPYGINNFSAMPNAPYGFV